VSKPVPIIGCIKFCVYDSVGAPYFGLGNRFWQLVALKYQFLDPCVLLLVALNSGTNRGIKSDRFVTLGAAVILAVRT
jgi:hypothetical protein